VVALHAQGDRIGPDLAGPVIDTAVAMRRLPPLALASERLARGTLQAADLTALATRVAAFHREAAVAPAQGAWGTAPRIVAQVRSTFEALSPHLEADLRPVLRDWIERQASRLTPVFEQRRADGHVREGHGDLHLDNVIVLGPGEVTAFDALEFDPALRWIDTQADLAFLVMDLLAHGRRDLAYGFLNEVLEHSGDYDGVGVLRWYVVWRALVRALVAHLREAAAPDASRLRAPDYLALVRRLLPEARGRLLITRGLPGSGKTHLTRLMLERAGALRLRSDVERRRLFPSASGRYAPEATEATYRHLARRAAGLLAAGCPVIVDAAFSRREQRDALRAVAAAEGVPFALLDCQAPLEVLQARVLARQRDGRDASEATLAVLAAAVDRQEPLDADEAGQALTVDTSRPIPLAQLVHRWLGGATATAA
nr:AAA family ATPase [Ideonella sp.]